MKTYCFFTHLGFGKNLRALTTPQATTNMLVEINNAALAFGCKKKHLKISTLTGPQKVKLAGGIARTAALNYLKSEAEFSDLPARRFVDFNLMQTQTYISIRPPPTKVLSDGSKIWRVAESESDKLRGKPRGF